MQHNDAALTELDRLVLTEYPYPIAISYRRMLEAGNAEERARRAIWVFDFTLRFCTLAIVSQYVRGDPSKSDYAPLTELVIGKLPRATLGICKEIFFTALKGYKGNRDLLFVKELYDLYWDTSRTQHKARPNAEEPYNTLITIRNQAMNAHEFGPENEAEWEATANDIIAPLREVLESSRFLQNYDLVLPVGLHEDSEQIRYTGLKFTGEHPTDIGVQHQPNQTLRPGHLYLSNGQEGFLPLYPWIIHWEDSKESGTSVEHGDDIAIFNTFTRNAVTYLAPVIRRNIVEKDALVIRWFLAMLNSLNQRAHGRKEREAGTIPAEAEIAIQNRLLKVSMESIVDLDVDALACSRERSLQIYTANPQSVYGAIQERGGRAIDEEAERQGPLERGAICVTTGGDLSSDHVIHVGIIDDITSQPLTEHILQLAVGAIMYECERQRWTSVAIPLMGTRAGGISEESCLGVMFREVARHLRVSIRYPQVVVFAVHTVSALAYVSHLIEDYTAEESQPQQPVLPPRETPVPRESDNASPRLRYAIENTFPRPIARAFYLLRGIDDWRAEIPQLANILGVTLQHLAVVALAEYLAGDNRDKVLNARLIETLQKPLTNGHWAGILRDTLSFMGKQPQEAFSAELTELYSPDGASTTVATIKAMSDDLITARNRLVHAPPDKPPTREEHDSFKRGLVELLQLVAFLKDYPLLSVKSTETQHGLKTHRCHLHMGAHDDMDEVEVQTDIDLEKSRIAMLRPASNELLYLYPFYILRQCLQPGCGATHLFSFERMEKGRIHYIATGGHQLREEGAGADLLELIDGSWDVQLRHKAEHMYIESSDTWHQLPVGHKVDKKYEVVEHLRRGGMADVYKVRPIGNSDTFLAMKLLPFQFLSDRTMVARFRKEATQSESLAHPNITRVHNHGMDVADHYLIMELAPGWTTPDGRQALDAGELPRPLDEATALDIVKQACEGLHYIHQPGIDIVHRDVKPGNLLLFDGGSVKLADFGIARSREAMNRTMTGQAMGTPEYISPEQAEGKKELTYATDIYSMGVVMYELLTGHTPFKRTTPLATMLARLHEPAPPPRTFKPDMPARLQSIVVKCLERDPERRYSSAKELYDAILSYEQEPGTEDNPPTLEAPSLRAVTASEGRVRAAWALVKGATGYVVELTHKVTGEKWTGETDQSQWESEPLDAGSYEVQVCARKGDEKGEWSREVEVKLAVFVPRPDVRPPHKQGFYGPPPPRASYPQQSVPQPSGMLHHQGPALSSKPRKGAWLAALVPALAIVVALGVWGIVGNSGQAIGGISGQTAVPFPQATATPTLMSTVTPTVTTDALTLTPIASSIGIWRATQGEVHSVAFSPDGKTIVAGLNNPADTPTTKDGVKEKKIAVLRVPGGTATAITAQIVAEHDNTVESVAFSPDGKTLATGSWDWTVRLWRLSDWSLIRAMLGHTNTVEAVAFAPDGLTLASASSDGTVRLWQVSDGKLLLTLPKNRANVSSLAFSHDGKLLAGSAIDNSVIVWQVSKLGEGVDLEILTILRKHQRLVTGVAFSPVSPLLASSSEDKTVRLWNTDTGAELPPLQGQGHSDAVIDVAFSPNGKYLASASSDMTVKLWDPAAGRLIQTLDGHTAPVWSVAFSPDSRYLVSGSLDGAVRLWELNKK